MQVNEEAGSNTGRSTRLPVVGKIYENEMVVAGTHITWGELTRGLTRLPVQTAEFGTAEEVVDRLLTLAKVFGKVRVKFGSPIAINSAYRPPNLKIGALYSQHKYGRALDVRPLNGDYKGLIQAIEAVPEVKGIGKGGPSYGFWHMDIRPISKRVYFDC
ncbi:MAG: D-Ala-D-Ala carboxypeptidase family metallohydrolase [Cyanobacteria bacterium J06635_11]